MLSIKPIGKRNRLWTVMSYQVVIGFPLFFDVRRWCWEQWGPGIEHEHYINYMFLNETQEPVALPWAWDCAKFRGASLDRGTIYLVHERQKMELQLRWQGNE